MINEITLHGEFSLPFPPLPEQCIYFYPRDPIQVATELQTAAQNPPSIIVGPQTKRVVITPGRQHLVVKIGFQPGGLYRLLKMPMNEISTTSSLDAVDIFGRETQQINDQLYHARSYDEMIRIIEQWLYLKMKTLKDTLPVDRLFRTIISQGGLISVEQMARSIYVSNRQLERQFIQRIGLSPKFFARLVRFAKAWTLKEHNQHLSWTDIAYESGYFDQMHMIRDFKQFSGVNPSVIEAALKASPFQFNNQLYY